MRTEYDLTEITNSPGVNVFISRTDLRLDPDAATAYDDKLGEYNVWVEQRNGKFVRRTERGTL